LIDETCGERIADLVWSQKMTMLTRFSQRTAGAAMLGLSVGPAAIAGVAFAPVYWKVGISFSAALISATISQIS
jgi:hypothetical protein